MSQQNYQFYGLDSPRFYFIGLCMCDLCKRVDTVHDLPTKTFSSLDLKYEIEECSICLVQETPCHHVFHESCLEKCKHSCPTCRGDIPYKERDSPMEEMEMEDVEEMEGARRPVTRSQTRAIAERAEREDPPADPPVLVPFYNTFISIITYR